MLKMSLHLNKKAFYTLAIYKCVIYEILPVKVKQFCIFCG